jgi:hypothetical protein
MNMPTKPGQRCRVIGSRTLTNKEGPSPNLNKVVITMFLHDLKANNTHDVWHCQGEGETMLTSYWGGHGKEADFLAVWLEVIEPEAPKLKQLETEEELPA